MGRRVWPRPATSFPGPFAGSARLVSCCKKKWRSADQGPGMRALIVSHYALPHVGGVEVLVDKEIRALVTAGHHVVLVTSDGAGAAQTPVYAPTVRVLHVRAGH